ncbi:LacI family transcriptional regulator [Bacillus sp. SLBN-46]|uniref:LacI family DNA-binding transcriptional regulator n=1 Tax=Bacillus sp. SLBN-46 TaxID=3042283 RepID=UPI002857A141|nr:LacI family DNA-binding transcriptional regulator [Bacillus sp. SLBN-46]MDR6125289.1 LacI family transcriptional regulator [Bacillus sp. SLBN-46]
MKKRKTLKDVADLSGVSTATVSYVINKTKKVSPEVEKKVLESMKALNYQPDMLAKSLRVKESKLIGLMISDIANSFFASIVRGIEDELSKSGYNVLLCNSDSNIEKEQNYLNLLLGKRIDGLIISAAGSSNHYFNKLKNMGVPAVFLNRSPDYANLDTVTTDNYGGSYQATEHLIEHGHKKIGIITGIQTISTGRERFLGFKQALLDHDYQLKDHWVKEGQFDVDSGYACMKQLMEQEDPPTAVFVCNNSMSLGVYQYIKEVGLRVPDKIAIIGFDDPEWASIVEPQLTSVAQPAYQQGIHAAELIMDKIKGQTIDRRQVVTLNPLLVIRNSCGCK